ncbi:MAG: cytochrome c3 family protein [Planctomycetota bacterium]|jgi:hypothetical protein
MKLMDVRKGVSLLLVVTLLSPALLLAASHRNCNSCHEVHATLDADTAGLPLWNDEVPIQIFTMYDSDTFQGTLDISGQPSGSSRLCLSCHEDWSAIGTDLTKMHPISFVYDNDLATADGFLYTIETATSYGGTIEEVLLDIDLQIQCISCHDVHRGPGGAPGTGPGGTSYMRGGTQADYAVQGTGAYDDLCRSCHMK